MNKSIMNTISLISIFILSSVLFGKGGSVPSEEDIAKKEMMEKFGSVPGVDEQTKNLSVEVNAQDHEPYSGFLGVKYSQEQDNMPKGPVGETARIIKNINNLSFLEQQAVLQKVQQAMASMTYEELKSIQHLTGSSIVDQPLYNTWLNMDRSGTLSLSRSTAGETEPNNTGGTADALSDTNTAYLTAFDEDWFTFTTTGASDILLETMAGSGTDNVGDSKMWLYNHPDSTFLAYDDDGGDGYYSKIAYRSYAGGTFYVRVTGLSSTTAGAYVLTYDNTAFSDLNGSLVINEIHYNPSTAQGNDSDYEFLELYNNSSADIQLGGLHFTQGIEYTFPASSSLSAGGYLVLAAEGTSYLGSTDWGGTTYNGLSNSGEDIEIRDSLGHLVDFVEYDDYSPWPTEADGDNPDGDGPSLELKDPSLDNSLASSWKVSGADNGTPGAANSMSADVLVANTTVSSFQGVGTSQTAAMEVKNLGYADLTIDSVTFSQYVPGAGATYSMPDASTYSNNGGNGSTGSSSVDVSETDIINNGVTLTLTWDIDSYASEGSATLTSPSGTVVTVISTSTYDGTYVVPIDTAFNGEAANGTWTFTVNDSYGDGGQNVTGISLAMEFSVGTTVVPAWVSATPPSSIAAGDSGDISFSFDASSITTNYDATADVKIFNNDPRDSVKTATASISVRAGGAILVVNNATWDYGFHATGDTASSTGTATVSNSGGADLVIDSVGFSAGASSNYFSNLTDTLTVEPGGSGSFTVGFLPTTSMALAEEGVSISSNADSVSGAIALRGVGYDTTTHTAFSDGASFLSSAYSYSGFGSTGYASSSMNSVISYPMVGASTAVIKARNINWTTGAALRVYKSSSPTATMWTEWTPVDTINYAINSDQVNDVSDYVYSTIDIGSAATDTVYLGFTFIGSYVDYDQWLYSFYLMGAALPNKAEVDEVVVEGPTVPEGYELEDFESFSTASSAWSGYRFYTTSSGGAVDNGAYIRSNLYSSYPLDSLVTPLLSPFEVGDSLSFYHRAIDYSGGTGTEFSAGDGMAVYVKKEDGSGRTQLWSVGDGYTSSSDWTRVKVDVPSELAGERGVFVFEGTRGSGDWWASYDEVLFPNSPMASLELSSDEIDFHGVSTSGSGRTAVFTVSNTGGDALTGTMTSSSAKFTLSAATISLLPDSSLEVSVSFDPDSAGPVHETITIASNAGSKTVALVGNVFKADFFHDFEMGDDLESLGYVSYNISGGVYWSETTGINSEPTGGSNMLKVASHQYGGTTLLVLPAVTVDADGERLAFDAKVNTTNASVTSTLYALSLTSNSYGSWTTADTLGKFDIGSFDTDWAMYFGDYYGIAQGTSYIGLLVEDNSTSYAGAATVYIDNVHFVDAPTVPIVTMHPFDQKISLLQNPFSFSNFSIGQNTGGDTLFISSISSSDSNMVISTVSDTVLKGNDILVNFSLAGSHLSMGHYDEMITFHHNDTIFTMGGMSNYLVETDFAHEAITFESGLWPDALMAMDQDGDGMNWQMGMTGDMEGNHAVFSNKLPDTPIGENMLATYLRHVAPGDKFIFDAMYTSPDPAYVHVMISGDWGEEWEMLDEVSVSWEPNPTAQNDHPMHHFEYDISAWAGSDVRLAIVDVNYGDSESDRLWVDRILLPAATNLTPIATARSMGADSSYTHAGDTVAVTGVVTVSDQFGSIVVFQDSSAGLAAYSSGMSADVEVGDRVIVEGKLYNYRSLLEISPVINYMVVESDVHVEPKKVSVGDLEDGPSAEALESMLLRVESVTWVDTSDWGGGSSGFNIDITRGADTATVRIDRDTDLYSQELSYGSINLTGVVQQYDYQSDPYEGFQFMPRSVDDLELMAQFSGIVTDALTGAGVSGVSVETDIDSVGTDATGHYVVDASLDAERIDFSKQNYTAAFFAVEASDAGFPVLDVGLDPSPDMQVYYNGLELVSDAGEVEVDDATGTQWSVVDSATFYSNFYVPDTVIMPYDGSKMLAIVDSLYANNSWSVWVAPGLIDLAPYTQATVRMHAFVDTETNYDEVSVMVRSLSDSTGDWTVLGEIEGHTAAWEEFSFSLDYIDMEGTEDMRYNLALLFESDGSVTYNGIAVDQIWVDGRNMFTALPPVNLMAESYGDNEVPLSWGAPGTDTATVQMQVINLDNWVNAEAIVNNIVSNDPSQSSLTVDQWLAQMRAANPRFTLHPQPETVAMPYVANTPASRGLRHYNVFKHGDEGWYLYDSTTSTAYSDGGVMNFNVYQYTVSAVYDEGESYETAPSSARPGPVFQHPIPMMVDFNVPEGDLPGDWYNEGVGEEGNEWSVSTAESVNDPSYFDVPGHGLFAAIDASDDSSSVTSAVLASDHFTMTHPLPAVYLKFDHFTGSSEYPIRTVNIRHAYGPWTQIANIGGTQGDWEEIVLDITEHVMPGAELMQIGFSYNEQYYSYRSGWAIDNVRMGIEPGPNNLIALPGAGEIHLHWGMDLGPEQDPGGSPSGFDENGRPVYQNTPPCEDCESANTRLPGVLFQESFDADQAIQFSEYDANLDSLAAGVNSDLTNWQPSSSDDNSWIRFSWSPSVQNFEHWIISDVFDGDQDTMYLMFDEYLDDYDLDGDTAAAHVSYDGGSTWTTVWEKADSSWFAPSGPAGFWDRHVIPIGVGTAQMHVAFSMRGVSSWNIDYWHVDNVAVFDELPEDQYEVYNVFRDGELIAEAIDHTMFMDHDVAFGDVYCYQIQPLHVSYPEGDVMMQGLSNTACSSPCNVPPPPAILSTPTDSALVVLVQDENGNIVDTEGNTSLEFSWVQPADHDGQEIANAFMLNDQLQSLGAMLEVPQGVTSVSISYEDLVVAMTNADQEEIAGSWGIWTADSIDNSCCWAQAMSDMNQLTVNISQALKVDSEFIPDVFAIHQNYPNPFNPITNILYDIPEASDVRITIYNIAGQKVRTLVQDQHEPGRYRIMWNATNDFGQPVSSGMYFYRIVASDFVGVKKLILMK